jgi:hypothetical protein
MAGESGSVSRQFATKLAGQFRNINSPGRAFLADFRISALWTLLVLRFSVKSEHAINPGSGERIAVIFRTLPCAERFLNAIQASRKETAFPETVSG